MGKLRIAIGILLVLGGLAFLAKGQKSDERGINSATTVTKPILTPTPSVSPTPSVLPTPTPIPLPDPKVYGPCLNVPVLMYHHVQPKEEAEAKNQKNINVNSDIFAQQMIYLREYGYTTIMPEELLQGLLTGFIPVKSILLTFDDGYADFYTYAYPELVKNNFRATVFLSTGLMGAPDYLSWDQIGQMKGGLVDFENHTWSHKNLGSATEDLAKYEIGTAKTQLEEHGLGQVTSLAYPYGTEGAVAKEVLRDLGINSAFTTVPGNYQCAKLPYSFRRTRVGNASLSAYGL
ncbi:MAG: polysaccharide deacetylase family protein [Patescibacteria group bacterium]